MTKLLVVLAVFASLVSVASTAYAGCGSLACYNNPDGTVWCAGAAGYDSESAAEIAALSLCDSTPPQGGCYIRQSECNTCIYGPGDSYACN